MYLSNNPTRRGISITRVMIINKKCQPFRSAQGIPNINTVDNNEKENAIRENSPIIAIDFLGVRPLCLRIQNKVKDVIRASELIDSELKVDQNSIFRII